MSYSRRFSEVSEENRRLFQGSDFSHRYTFCIARMGFIFGVRRQLSVLSIVNDPISDFEISVSKFPILDILIDLLRFSLLLE